MLIRNSVRLTPSLESDYDLLVVGGEDHKTGQATDYDARYAKLWNWTKERFPMVESIVDKWSGQVSEPADSLAYIGRNPSDYDNVFIITGGTCRFLVFTNKRFRFWNWNDSWHYWRNSNS